MKRVMAFAFALVLALGLVGCGKRNTHRISITIPAGSTEEFIFSEEEISAVGSKITISSDSDSADAEVILSPVSDTITPGYVAKPVTPECPASFDAAKGEWFKIGLRVRNDTDTDKTFYVTVGGVEVRIQ